MKKKLLAVLLTGTMVMSMLTACGGGSLEMASRAHQKDTITAIFQDTLDLWERVVTFLKTCLP